MVMLLQTYSGVLGMGEPLPPAGDMRERPRTPLHCTRNVRNYNYSYSPGNSLPAVCPWTICWSSRNIDAATRNISPIAFRTLSTHTKQAIVQNTLYRPSCTCTCTRRLRTASGRAFVSAWLLMTTQMSTT